MASAKVTVKAGANGPVLLVPPVDGRRSIGDEPFEVENTRYIRGRIAAGDLVAVQVPVIAVTARVPRATTLKGEE